MSAYILPNSILFLAIVLTIFIIARHFPEAARQLEESGAVHTETAQDVIKRWLLKVRGGLRAFWRFVLEGKGLRDPKGSKFRMRQLLEQNRVLKTRVKAQHSAVSSQHARPAVASKVSVVVAATTEAVKEEVTVSEQGANLQTPVVPVTTEEVVVVPKPPVSGSRRKPVALSVSPEVILQQAKKFIDAKEFLRARHELERIVESYEDSPVFWARLGYVQYHLGAYAEAIRCYQKSLALDSSQANRYYNLALAYEAAQEHAESLSALDQALVLDPGNVKYQQTRDALKTM